MIKIILGSMDLESAIDVRRLMEPIKVYTGRWQGANNFEIVADCEYSEIPKLITIFNEAVHRVDPDFFERQSWM